MNELHLFAGAGGGILGGQLLGHTTVCAVEIEPYCRDVLLQRQRDGMLPKFPIWDDVKTFDGRPWRGLVDVVCGGFPCQDISCAGKGAGIDGERSGLWREFARVICEVRPKYAFVENSPMLTSRGLGRVLGDLAEIGYDAVWTVLGADDVGAPHRRKRIWILAHARLLEGRRGVCGQDGNILGRRQAGERSEYTNSAMRPSERAATMPDPELLGAGRREQFAQGEQEKGHTSNVLPDTESIRERNTRKQREILGANGGQDGRMLSEPVNAGMGHGKKDVPNAEVPSWWRVDPADERGAFESQLGRVAHGVAHRVDRLKAIGNGQVPLVAATAFKILTQTLERKTQ